MVEKMRKTDENICFRANNVHLTEIIVRLNKQQRPSDLITHWHHLKVFIEEKCPLWLHLPTSLFMLSNIAAISPWRLTSEINCFLQVLIVNDLRLRTY